MYYGITTVNRNYNFSLGVKQSLFKGKGSLSANISDVFWKSYYSGVSTFSTVVEVWNNKYESRVFHISFNYNFGSGEFIMRRTSGSDDEKNRSI